MGFWRRDLRHDTNVLAHEPSDPLPNSKARQGSRRQAPSYDNQKTRQEACHEGTAIRFVSLFLLILGYLLPCALSTLRLFLLQLSLY